MGVKVVPPPKKDDDKQSGHMNTDTTHSYVDVDADACDNDKDNVDDNKASVVALRLQRWNVVAGIVHLLSFIAKLLVTVIFNDTAYRAGLILCRLNECRVEATYPLTWVNTPF